MTFLYTLHTDSSAAFSENIRCRSGSHYSLACTNVLVIDKIRAADLYGDLGNECH